MTDLFPITTADLIAEMQRELAMRERVYARQVGAKQLTQAVADRRIAIVKIIIERLQETT